MKTMFEKVLSPAVLKLAIVSALVLSLSSAAFATDGEYAGYLNWKNSGSGDDVSLDDGGNYEDKTEGKYDDVDHTTWSGNKYWEDFGAEPGPNGFVNVLVGADAGASAAIVVANAVTMRDLGIEAVNGSGYNHSLTINAGAVLTVGNNLNLATSFDTNASLTMTGGTLVIADQLSVGERGSATMTVDPNSTLIFSSGSLGKTGINIAKRIGASSLTLTGVDTSIPGRVEMAKFNEDPISNPSSGTLNLVNSDLDVGGNFRVGRQGVGTLNVSGTSAITINGSRDATGLGLEDGDTGSSITLSDSASIEVTAGGVKLGDLGDTSLTMSGTTSLKSSGDMVIGEDDDMIINITGDSRLESTGGSLNLNWSNANQAVTNVNIGGTGYIKAMGHVDIGEDGNTTFTLTSGAQVKSTAGHVEIAASSAEHVVNISGDVAITAGTSIQIGSKDDGGGNVSITQSVIMDLTGTSTITAGSNIILGEEDLKLDMSSGTTIDAGGNLYLATSGNLDAGSDLYGTIIVGNNFRIGHEDGSGSIQMRDGATVTVVGEFEVGNDIEFDMRGGTLSGNTMRLSSDAKIEIGDNSAADLALNSFKDSVSVSVNALDLDAIDPSSGIYLEPGGVVEIDHVLSDAEGIDIWTSITVGDIRSNLSSLDGSGTYLPSTDPLAAFQEYGVLVEDDGFTTAIHIGAIPILPGDFDLNGKVDGADFLDWQRNDGSAVGLLKWKQSYGDVVVLAAAAVTAVPEPSSLMLLAVGLVGLGCRRRKRT